MNIYKTIFCFMFLLFFGAGTVKADGINKGDANSDNSINVADIVALRRKINLDTPDNFNEWSADVNGDGSYNVADIVAIRNIINYGMIKGNGTIEGWIEGNEGEELTEHPLEPGSDSEPDEGD